eukprot:5045575-Pyramimonas_sp.AAC.1
MQYTAVAAYSIQAPVDLSQAPVDLRRVGVDVNLAGDGLALLRQLGGDQILEGGHLQASVHLRIVAPQRDRRLRSQQRRGSIHQRRGSIHQRR